MSQNSTRNGNITEEKVIRFVLDRQLLKEGDRVLAGVSGGADSVCLLFVLLSLRSYFGGRLHIEVVHVHHMLRGKEADEDMAYVEELCRSQAVPFHPVMLPVKQIAEEQGWSVEEAGRRVRYDTFDRICRERRLHKIAVAHHRDDQAETVLMNLFRGSGLKGMAGIPAVRGNIIRPLLAVSREEIEAYLTQMGIMYRTDSTNLDCDYTRNRVRNQLLPYIEENINKQASMHIVQFAARAGEIDCYFQKKANLLFEKYGRTSEKRVILCLDCLKEDKTELVYLIRKVLNCLVSGLKDISQEHLEQVYRLMMGRTGGRCYLPGKVQVEKSYDTCEFRFVDTEAKEDKNAGGSSASQADKMSEAVQVHPAHLHENIPYTVSISGVKFIFTVKNLKKNETFPKKKYTKWFDCDKINFTLQLRTRKNGDYIVINSAGGHKKLKDYLIDNKIPRQERDRLLLLTEGAELLWIVGMRISERYKVTDNTTKILEVRME